MQPISETGGVDPTGLDVELGTPRTVEGGIESGVRLYQSWMVMKFIGTRGKPQQIYVLLGSSLKWSVKLQCVGIPLLIRNIYRAC